MANLLQPEFEFCPPETLGVPTMVGIVLAYVNTRPDLLDDDLAVAVLVAFHAVWPCPAN